MNYSAMAMLWDSNPFLPFWRRRFYHINYCTMVASKRIALLKGRTRTLMRCSSLTAWIRCYMVAEVGFAPTKLALGIMRPATLTTRTLCYMATCTGFEPVWFSPWQGDDYCQVVLQAILVDCEGVEPSLSGCKPDVLPLSLTAHVFEDRGIWTPDGNLERVVA